MNTVAGLRPLRVEQVLRVLPDIDALAPLRASIISRSQTGTAAEPYLTVGKRVVDSTELRQLVPGAVAQFTRHLAQLYDGAVVALEAMERGDMAAAARALLRAGQCEEAAGRDSAARAWYEMALRIAEELRDRRPELEALRHLGDLEAGHGSLELAARFYQRSFALADAEQDVESAALACQGLGEVALARGLWQGASSWYAQGLRYASDNPLLTALLTIGQVKVATARDDREGAERALRQARALLVDLRHTEGMARLHNAWGLLDAMRGRFQEALLHYREALAQLRSGERNPRLEMEIRLNACDLFITWGHLAEAEDELRRAENLAIANNLTRELARTYVAIGRLRGRQGDDTGFIFFEKAIELSQGREPSPRIEAAAYFEYGLFKQALGEHEEGPAYLERARDLLTSVGDDALRARVESELARVQLQ